MEGGWESWAGPNWSCGAAPGRWQQPSSAGFRRFSAPCSRALSAAAPSVALGITITSAPQEALPVSAVLTAAVTCWFPWLTFSPLLSSVCYLRSSISRTVLIFVTLKQYNEKLMSGTLQPPSASWFARHAPRTTAICYSKDRSGRRATEGS